MISQVQLSFDTPADEAQLQAKFDEFQFLHHFVPYKLTDRELYDILAANLGNNTLIYANGILIGCCILDVYGKSVELHGIARPDMGRVVPFSNRVKIAIYHIIFDRIFNHLGKQKVVIKADPSNRGVKGFARMWGFERIPNTDKGRLIWKLTRDAYLSRIDHGKE